MTDEPQRPTSGDRNAWGDDISDGRKAELKALADKQREWVTHPEATRGDSALKGVKLTGADVFWLATYALAGPQASAEELAAKRDELGNSAHFRDVSTLLLQGADLWQAHLQGAHLGGAQLQGARLAYAHLQGAQLRAAQLRDANLAHAQLQGARLAEAELQGADLDRAQLQGAHLDFVQLQGAHLDRAQLQGAHLDGAHLEGVNLLGAQLHDAILVGAQLQGAYMYRAKLYGANLVAANLQGANLTAAYFNAETTLISAVDSHTRLADVVWNNCPLTQVPWQQAPRLGDETVAWQPRFTEEFRRDTPKHADIRREEFATAVRAYRVLAATLRAQGMNEDADRYAYRAQLMQRIVLRRQRQYLRWLGSLFLWLISGYGYRPLRSVATYVLVILAFAGAYLINAQFAAPHLTWDEALVLSISAFHGRGFFTSGISLGDTLARLAAGEAIIGLLIEITFIATFTQRFFAR